MPFTNVTTRLSLPLMEASQAQKHLVYNALVQKLDIESVAREETSQLTLGSLGGFFQAVTLEESVALTGASVNSTIEIPDRMILLGVTSRITSAITGATSYDCGVAGEVGKFGATLGISEGSSNKGVIGPQAFYEDTPILITANGSDFTGGTVVVSIHGFTLGLPT